MGPCADLRLHAPLGLHTDSCDNRKAILDLKNGEHFISINW